MENQANAIRQFIQACKSSVCFLHISSNLITEELKEGFTVLDMANDFSPYKPFLSILKDNNDRFSINELVSKAFISHKKSIESYFLTDFCTERYDIPLSSEIIYEQSRYIETFVNILHEKCVGNYLILNAQCLSECSLNLIKELEKVNFNGKIAFCFSTLQNDMEITDAIKFLEDQRLKANYLQVLSDKLVIYKDRTQYNQILELEEESQYKIIMKTLRNNRVFICYKQLKDFADWVSKNFIQFSYFSEDEKNELCLELAKCLCECNSKDEAILYLNDILDSPEEDYTRPLACFHLARIFGQKKSFTLAVKYLSLATKVFETADDKNMLALCAMLDFQFTKNVDEERDFYKYKLALERLEKQELWNNYISTAISLPWQLVNDEGIKNSLDSAISNYLELAQKVDNQHLISTVYHWRGIVCSHFGEMDQAIMWYDKCNEIRTEIGEITPLLNIRNGLCYDATCRAMYKRAYDLENGIIARLPEINDFASIADALKNLSYALFYSRHYSKAYEIFNIITHYLQVFNMEEFLNNSFLPSINDMLIFKSIIDFDLGDYIRARINHSNIVQNTESITKEDMPFLYFLEALLHVEERDLVSAETLFLKCISEFNKLTSNMSHKVVFSFYEFAVVLSKLGYEEQSKKYLRLGFKLAQKNGFTYYTKGKKRCISLTQYIKGIEEFDPLNIEMTFFKERAEKEQLLSLLHKRIHDYQFINKIKTCIIHDLNIKKYMQTILLEIGEYTMAEEVHFGVMEASECKTMESFLHSGVDSVTPEIWKRLFKKSKKSDIAHLVFDEESGVYFGDISYADYRFAIIIKPSKGTVFNTDVINTILIALSSVQSQVVIFKQEEHLMIMSSTDQLSRLKNRNAFQEYISLESERVRRYQQRKETVIQIAVGFIDLDNFKYYNDTFGHNVGDFLIKSFANLLRETCRKIDFISRYGGDEFVIIMVDTNASEGVRVFQRLKEKLEEHHYFVPQIKSLLKDVEVNVPPEKLIGFSMGISTNHDVAECDNLDVVVQNADKALYYSKNKCKGSVSIWSEIKDLV
ncbi:MAG: diguanylate cyclase [Treponema sp.]|nr:diguanylate cyclase [Treponema sp.]